MTTKYSSRESAIRTGLTYLGIEKSLRDLPLPETVRIRWPREATMDVYTIENSNEERKFGVGKYDGENSFSLWLICPESGDTIQV
jgi:hypothetical protein